MQGSRSSIVHRRSSIVYRRSSIFVVTCALVALAIVESAAQYSFEQVTSGLKARDAETRIRAIEILRDSGYPEAAAPIAVAIEDSDDRVQLEAIAAERALFLAKIIPRRKKVAHVIELRGQDVTPDAFAAEQLAVLPRRAPTPVLWALVAAMRDDNPRIRLEAMNVFGMLAPLGGAEGTSAIRSGISWTIEALRKGDLATQLAATAIAGRAQQDCGLAPEHQPAGQVCAELGNALIATINARNPQLRRAAMRAVGQLRYAAAAQALSDQLSYYDHGVDAETALEALSAVGHSASVEIFKRQLANPSAKMRRLAVEGLGRAGDSADVSELDQLGQSERSTSVMVALHFAAVKMTARGAARTAATPKYLADALADPSLRSQALAVFARAEPRCRPFTR
jgi:HEAT repeat protein